MCNKQIQITKLRFYKFDWVETALIGEERDSGPELGCISSSSFGQPWTEK